MASTRWVNWFSSDTTEVDSAFEASIASAQECLSVAAMPWFKKYLSYLEDQSQRPSRIGDHVDMIVSATRSNTLREMRLYLLEEIDKARVFLNTTKEN